MLKCEIPNSVTACLSEDLLLRLSNTAAGTIAAHEDIEGLEIGSERNRVAAGSLLLRWS